MALLKILQFWLCFGSILVLIGINPTIRQLWFVFSSIFALLPVTSWLMYFTRKYILNPHLSSKGKAVLITGCDSGFGQQLAERLDRLGYHVFAGCLDANGEGAKSLGKSCSKKLKILLLDVTNDQHIQNALEYVKRNLNDNVLWSVVNNAGVAQAGEIEWTPMEEFQKVQEVNVFGAVRVTKAFLPLLRQAKGRVVNNTSFCAHLTFPGYVGYCMSKCAVASFTTGLRIEMVKWGVKSISVEPFFYKTPLTTEEANSKLIQSTWDKAPEEIKETYGGKYIAAFKESCRRLLKRSSSQNSEVLDSFVDAIASSDPLNSYFPCYFPHKLFLSSFLILPRCFAETYQRLQMPIRVKPASLNKFSTNIKKNSTYGTFTNGTVNMKITSMEDSGMVGMNSICREDDDSRIKTE